MTVLAALRSWLRATLHRAGMERRMDEEVRFHLQAYADDLVRAGVAPEEARRRAHVEFGGLEERKEECRDVLGVRLLDELTADGRYAVRQIRRSPAFSVAAILSLALGIGASTTLFSLVEAAVWKPSAVHEPGRLALFSWVSGPHTIMNSTWGDWSHIATSGRASTSFSYPVFEALRKGPTAFQTIFAFKPVGRLTVIVDGEAEHVPVQLVSGDFYSGIGVAPQAGRGLSPADDAREASETVGVISDGFWARHFARSPSAIGKRVLVNQVPITVVGVNPASFTGVEPGDRPDVFLPLTAQPLVFPWRYARTGSLLDDPDYWWVVVMGRLRDGGTLAQAEPALEVAFQQAVDATLPDRGDRDRPHLRLRSGSRGQDNLRHAFGAPLFGLFALVGVVLLMASANVANLLLARATVRRRELGLRLALGARRWRIVRQLLTEGLALSLAGAAVGIVLAHWARNAIPRLLSPSWASGDLRFDAAFDLRVVLLATAVTMVVTVLFSLAPIWQAMHVELGAALKDGGRGTVAGPLARGGKWLVVFQVCVSVTLLAGAGLLVRTLSNLRSVPLGFRPEHVLLFVIDPPRVRYQGSARSTLFLRLEEAIGAVPGVEAASLSSTALLAGGRSQTRVGVNGQPPGPADEAWVNDVGAGFFETMGIPILSGRSFDAHDREGSAPVVVVSQRFAREFFPGQDCLGKTVRNNDVNHEIVGIVGDTPFGRVREPIPPTFYRHFTQTREPGAMTFEVRTAGAEGAVMSQVREAVRLVDKDLAVFDVRTQTQQADAILGRERLFVTVSGSLGVLAALLASVGVYGLLAHGVSRRITEIGVRLTLGATRQDVLFMVLREATLLAGVGGVLGVVLAATLSQYVRAILFGVAPADPWTLAGALAVMMVVAMAAGWFPARRASRLDPMAALRHE